MNRDPKILLVCSPGSVRQRWHEALESISELSTPQDLGAPRDTWSPVEPDLCVVDLDLVTEDQQLILIALRGLYASAQLIAIAGGHQIDTLLTSVNEGMVSRIVPADSSAEDIRSRILEAWNSEHSTRALRSRLGEVLKERDQLMVSQRELRQSLATRHKELTAANAEQIELRQRLKRLMDDELNPRNSMPFERLQTRIREEMEKYRRYGHPASVLRFDVIPSEGQKFTEEQADRLLLLVSEIIRHIDLVAMRGQRQVVVLLPMTERAKAERTRERILSALVERSTGVDFSPCDVFSYPEDGDEVLID